MGLAVVWFACAVLSPAKLWRPNDGLGPVENPQIAEAISWWQGRLDLPERLWDTALIEKPARRESNGTERLARDSRTSGSIAHPSDGGPGERATQRFVYSPFPPLFSIIAAMFVPLFGGVPHLGIVLLLAVPIPALAYRLFFRTTKSALDTAILTLGMLMGTSLWPVLEWTLRAGNPYVVNQSLAVVGQLVFLNEFVGRRRLGIAAVGVVIAALSRQLTIAYLLPLAWMMKECIAPSAVAWVHAPTGDRASRNEATARGASGPPPGMPTACAAEPTGPPTADPCHPTADAWQPPLTSSHHSPLTDPGHIQQKDPCGAQRTDWDHGHRDGERRARRGVLRNLPALVFVLLFTVAFPMTLNAFKFGSPLESGYRFIYRDRPEDSFSRDVDRFGVFSVRYVPRNLYYMNLGPPDLHTIELEGRKVWRLRANDWGTGIWWTTPLLLFLFRRFRSILSDPAERMLLLSVAVVVAGQLCYHGTGYRQHGFNRFSMDFVPVLFVLAAGPRPRVAERPWMLLAITWSILYFGWVI